MLLAGCSTLQQASAGDDSSSDGSDSGATSTGPAATGGGDTTGADAADESADTTQGVVEPDSSGSDGGSSDSGVRPDDDGTSTDGTSTGDGSTDGSTDDGGTDGSTDGSTDDGGTDGSTDGSTDDGGTDGSTDDSTDGPVVVGSLAQGIEGWVVDPYGTDTAVTGVWGYGQPPVGIWNKLLLEMGSTPSGDKGWFTLSGTGPEMGDHDLDDGESSVLSPVYSLPQSDDIHLDFDYYLSYLTNATSDDSLRVVMITNDGNKVILNEQARPNTNKEAKWKSLSVDLTSYAGQNVQFLITAGDRSTPSYVEAAIDGFAIVAE